MSIPFDIAALSAQVLNSLSDDSDIEEEIDPSNKISGDNELDATWTSQINDALQQLDTQSNPQPWGDTLDLGLPSWDHLTNFGHDEFVPDLGPGSVQEPVPDIGFTEDQHNELMLALTNSLGPASSDQQLYPCPISTINEPSQTATTPADPFDEVDQMLDRLFNSAVQSPSQASISAPSPTFDTSATSNVIAIDPSLEPFAPSPPTTLSTPQSPQPILRKDASTSQTLLTADTPIATPRPRLREPQTSAVQRPTPSLTTSSLEHLANPPPGQQPNYPWWTIIRAAIMGSRYGMMTREQICEALANRWEYFRSTDDHETRVWKSAVGHNLSVKECFVRVYVEGEGNTSYYIIDTAVDPAKGRLSKGKNPDRATVPRIARRPVLPNNLDLSTQARWSPAIAAIRNAKYGFPEVRMNPSKSKQPMESDSDEDDEDDDESDSGDSTEPETVPRPLPGSLLGSSLSAIVGTSRSMFTKEPTRNPSLTNRSANQPTVPARQNRPPARPELKRAQQTSRSSQSKTNPRSRTTRRRPPKRPSMATRTANTVTPQVTSLPVIPETHHASPAEIPVIPLSPQSPVALRLEQQVAAALADVTSQLPLDPVDDIFDSHHQEPHEIPRFPSPIELSLQQQVEAALADVTASLPSQLEPDATVERSELQQENRPDDPSLPTELDLPLFDFENLMEKVQAEVGKDTDTEESDLIPGDGDDDVPPVPLFDFGNLMEEVQAEIGKDLVTEDDSDDGENGSSHHEEININLDTMLADAHSEMRLNSEPALSPLPLDPIEPVASGDPKEGVDVHEESQSEKSHDSKKRSADQAGLDNLLDTLINQATACEDNTAASPPALNDFDSYSDFDEAESSTAVQHLDNAIAEALAAAEAQAQETFLKELEEREKARMKALSEQVTSSLVGVVQLTASGDIPVHPLPLPPAPPASPVQPAPRPAAIVRVNHIRARPTLPSRRAMLPPSRPVIRTSVGIRPKSTNIPTYQPVDRRTRAAGTRAPGRKLNLPLPSAHTPVTVDDRIDETALAPSLLESIQVVTLERPRSTFPEIAKEAILSHPGGKMTAAEIFKVVEKKYPYFLTAPESWKATMRNVLTSHSCFVKIPRPADAPGRGDWWSTVDLPLWKRRRTTAKAKQDEDFLGRHAREQLRKGRVKISTSTTNNNHPHPHHSNGVRSLEISLPRPFNLGIS